MEGYTQKSNSYWKKQHWAKSRGHMVLIQCKFSKSANIGASAYEQDLKLIFLFN